ncbi:zinc finger protein MYND domain-containing protein-like protein [Leptotrombidium deliense]|uniref:Zinc finger protein MYND domain-containing protein-like protein n=1 Tax=Leptotrombidium deliense TaxID=299467 RepID=A0A443SCC0_9ACAR|nr:zinc finger protein MYND domain-containing protein-like protein [Leptotrombidium deliense]
MNSEVGKRAQQMYSFIQSEYMYMHNCFDCYVYYARDKSKDKRNIWFLMPCNPPHEIVFAKGDTFPYFPAKVIKSEKDQSYLWFFGDHEVCWVHSSNMTPKLPLKEPISRKLKLALVEMEKYKQICNRYQNGKVNFSGIARIKEKEIEDDSD